MASQPVQTRSERVVVLLTPDEKRELGRRAQEAGLSVSEYLRFSAELGAMTPAEREELALLAQEMEAMSNRLEATFAALDRTSSRVIDEDALRARYRAELETRTDIDWVGLHDSLTGTAH